MERFELANIIARMPEISRHLALEDAQTKKRLTYLAAGVGVCLVAYKLHLRKRWFAWLFNAGTGARFEKYDNMKREFFKPLSDMASHDPELREENSIKILEVGVGSGTNFEFFPDGCHLVAVDPNPFFGKYYDQNRSKFPNIKSTEIIVAKGENMDEVKNDSVDAVVMTLVLCSVSDVHQIIRQVRRVLAPGGKFYFIEHVKEWDSKNHWLRRRLQQFLTFTGFWPLVFDGCRLDSDPMPVMRALGGFSEVKHEYFYAPVPGGVAKLVESHLRGVATK
ncbi:thiol S-methyltransferase TMT1A-like [Macrobrachium nipponense]|uniref:thiol S-methyltransferase TMT1A-like n=1 Tax=Macrobrachium nipponense TaxID=159736 RepID=UPI0030C7EAD6